MDTNEQDYIAAVIENLANRGYSWSQIDRIIGIT